MTGKTVHILLIEDDDIDAEGILRGFKKAHIANPIYRAKDGVQALDMLRGTNGEQKLPSPRILLVDINMPRMNGIDFIKNVREDETLHRSIAFMLTTSKNDKDRMAAYDLNVAGYLVKSNAGDCFMNMIDMLDHYWRLIELPA